MGRLNLEYFLAKRIASVSSGRRNNVMVRVATLSVAIGVAVMIVSLAVIFGFKREITAKLSGFGAHVQIASLDGNASSYETEPVSRDQPFADYLRGIPRFESFNPYAVKGGILRGEEAMQGIVLKGVDSTYDWTPMRRSLVAGRLPDVSDTVRHKEVLLSRAVADRMEADVGDPIEMLFVQNPPRRDRFRVSGIYDTGFGELDRVLALTDLRNVQRIASPDNGLISGYEIMAARGVDAADVAAAAEQAIETAFYAGDESVGSAAAVTLRERYPVVFDWLKTHDVNARVILAVMMAVVLFNMASAMLIMVLDRTGMIGVLKAMGMRNGAVRRVFLYRAAMLFVRGAAWGNAVGLAIVGLQAWLHPVRLDPEGYMLSVLPVRVEVWWVVALNVGAVAVTVAVMTLPSMIVARISPEQTLKYRQ